MRPLVWLAVAAFLGSGCATIAGRKQVIAVDTDPRGVDLYVRGSRTPVGQTPLFIEVTRGRHLSLTFGAGGKRATARETCSVRWKGFALADGVLTILAPPLGLASGAVDLMDGAAFQCDELYSFPLALKTPSSRHQCRRYLVAPPHHPDEGVSDLIAKRWIERQTATLGGCDSVVDYDEARTSFAYLNYTHEFNLHPGALDRAQINALGLATHATDLVFLQRTEASGPAVVRPLLMDMYTGAREGQKQLVFEGQEGDRVGRNDKHVLGYSFSLIPNSFTYSVDRTSIHAEPGKSGDSISGLYRRDTLPQYLTGISLTDVQHPMGIGTWGLKFRVFPLIVPAYWDLAYDLHLSDTGPVNSRRARVIQVLAQEYVGMTLHTPLGAFEVAAGAGSDYIEERTPDVSHWDAVLLVTSTEFTYTAFLTNHLFFQARTWDVHFPVQTVRLDQARLVGYVQGSVGLGYFLPTMRSHLRHALFGDS